MAFNITNKYDLAVRIVFNRILKVQEKISIILIAFMVLYFLELITRNGLMLSTKNYNHKINNPPENIYLATNFIYPI